MAYAQGLAQRIEEYFQDRTEVKTKTMFGGLCFMLSGHMCCGIVDDNLMARVGPDNYERCLNQAHAREMDFTGKPMKGMVFVSAAGLENDSDLCAWLGICEAFVQSLPPK